jgi:hypothetical protein
MVEDALAGRRLVWLGKRGEDAAPLLRLSQFSASFSIYAPLQSRAVHVLSVESLTGVRDEAFSLDGAISDEGKPFLSALLDACGGPSVLMAYRPYGFLWASEGSTLLPHYLGGTHDGYVRLEDKPSVEQSLVQESDIECVPWTYLPQTPDRRRQLELAARSGPIVLRANVSSGGEGLELIKDACQLSESNLLAEEEMLAWSPYLADYVPVNLAGCVFGDGGVTLHTPSLQLIGLPQCTPLALGYCGNDYAAIKHLEPAGLKELECIGQAAGRWLWRRGYRGAFGLDAMVRDGHALFTEINARFQGSSRLSAAMDEQAGRPDIFLDHLMALFGMASYESPSLLEQVLQQTSAAQVICYNLERENVRLPPRLSLPEGVTASLLPAEGVAVDHNSAMFALTFDQPVTSDGLSTYPEVTAIVEGALREVRPAVSGSS